MKVAVVYYSQSGNTRRIAEEIAQVLHGRAFPLDAAEKGRKTRNDMARETAD